MTVPFGTVTVYSFPESFSRPEISIVSTVLYALTLSMAAPPSIVTFFCWAEGHFTFWSKVSFRVSLSPVRSVAPSAGSELTITGASSGTDTTGGFSEHPVRSSPIHNIPDKIRFMFSLIWFPRRRSGLPGKYNDYRRVIFVTLTLSPLRTNVPPHQPCVKAASRIS